MTERYYNRANPDVLRVIPRDATVVLEIGCGAGALAAAYKQFNPACRYVGVEVNADMAKRAREHADKVLTGDVETLDLAKLDIKKGEVDCLVYGDVLEHLVDPWAALEEHASYVREDGVVAACIPNVSHWTMLYGLLRGHWRYQEDGLLDRTHLRFFTLDSVRSLFDSAGLHIFDIFGRSALNENFEVFHKAIKPTLDALGIREEAFIQQAKSCQYVVRGRKNPKQPQKVMIQSMMLRPQAACNDIRILHPQSFLQTIPGVQVANKVKNIEVLPAADPRKKVVIWHRPIMQPHVDLASVKKLMERGYLILVDWDDHPDHWPLVLEHNYLTFRACHGVVVPHQKLADFLTPYNPNVFIAPNQVYALPSERKYTKKKEVTVFFGALNRSKDWEPLVLALERVIKRFGKQLKFQVVHDQAFFDMLPTEQKVFTDTCPYEEYCALLGEADIALMPLADTPFNHMKSDLKFIEAAAHGAVALASPPVYAEVIKDGKTGVVFADPEAFEERFAALVEDHEHRQTIAKQAYAYVKENRLMGQHYQARYDFYLKQHAKLEQLNEELLKRTPEMEGV